MRRRDFIALAAAAGAATPLVARAQQGATTRIGFLLPSSYEGEIEPYIASFRRGLFEHGRLEGRDYRIELRSAGGHTDRLPSLAAELVAMKVNVIVVSSTLGARATVAATRTIPIVQVAGGDPTLVGLAQSLSRPGGNLTGMVNQSEDKTGKLLELLRMAVPSVSQVGVLHVPAAPVTRPQMEDLQAAARSQGVTLHLAPVPAAAALNDAFATLARKRVDGLVVFSAALFSQLRDRIVSQAATTQLPAAYPYPEYARFGGLICYGIDRRDNYRQAARFVDRILKGANPGDLPIEQPTRFSLAINVKTAKALGLTVPPMLLAIADEVIE